jgi:hypothetical protein
MKLDNDCLPAITHFDQLVVQALIELNELHPRSAFSSVEVNKHLGFEPKLVDTVCYSLEKFSNFGLISWRERKHFASGRIHKEFLIPVNAVCKGMSMFLGNGRFVVVTNCKWKDDCNSCKKGVKLTEKNCKLFKRAMNLVA